MSSKRESPATREELGKGAIEGVAGPEAANNVATFGPKGRAMRTRRGKLVK
jgi:TctA family transporter